jgi:solute carrier family 8 (sodium/calcium exchanger)
VKKVEKLAKQPGCEEVREWTQSISNHMYWSASSTPDGNPDVILAKWLSLSNHIQNVHEGHDNENFPRCAHDDIEESGRKKKWLKPSKFWGY